MTKHNFPTCTTFSVSTLPASPLPPWSCSHLPQEMSGQYSFFPSLLSPFLLRGIGAGNYLISQSVHLCASWFVSISSLSSDNKRHLSSSAESHSLAMYHFWSTMVSHSPQSEVAPHYLSAVRNPLICILQQDTNPMTGSSTTISYLPLQYCFVSGGDYHRSFPCLHLCLCPDLILFGSNHIPELCLLTKK